MTYIKKMYHLIDNYFIARLQNRPSTALFWYLPETANIKSNDDLGRYQQTKMASPFYLMDYRKKLHYSLTNTDGVIVLPYQQPIGSQINPEASFEYALGLHDQHHFTQEPMYLQKFFQYTDYFISQQTEKGIWYYHFDWFGSKAPWYSALAQARGASVMLRAFLHTKEEKYYLAATKAVNQFTLPTKKGGFLHTFTPEKCVYFEEYPQTPTGVINGFMACLMSLWELDYWLKEKWLNDLWLTGIHSLQKMLPYYSNGWWSLYDLDVNTPIKNVNSPRYHLMEMDYLQILGVLSGSDKLFNEYNKRRQQYNNPLYKLSAYSVKCVRKILYK